MSLALRRRLRPSLRLILLYVALGSAFLPGVLVSAAFTLTHGHIAQGPIVRILGASEEVNRAVELDGKGHLVAKKGYASPAWLDLVVTDREGRVVFSTIASLAPGSKPSLVDVAGFAEELVPKATFFSDKVEMGRIEAGTWYAILPSDSARSLAGETVPLMRFAGLAVFALIAFVFSFVVAAALAAHVGRLEKAAIAIAAGDLESPIGTRGPREIVALAEAMESMRAAIREDQARRARFLAAVSHDLRTPLTSIGGYLEAIEDGLAADPATLGHYVATMRERTQALEERIEGLIDFARMESGEWRLRFESLSLSALFGGLAAFAREEAALVGASFEEELGAIGDLELRVDKALLGRAFENLVANALAHGRPGGSIWVGARRLSNGGGQALLAIDVDDDGPGIPEAERGRAFEAFWRGSPSRGRGSGLGLYIARSIVEGHGWRLELSASPQGGARFSFLIPAQNHAGKDA
ncbi:MAG TPA: HAMP domain-containing sensor histidine kinase [Rectinemataceae bacterium]|nr:HAMP domain-containing sensor histidine kinase [Rectinemataceae bacterium]